MTLAAGDTFRVYLSNAMPAAINNGDYDYAQTNAPFDSHYDYSKSKWAPSSSSSSDDALFETIGALTSNSGRGSNNGGGTNGFEFASSTNLHFHGIHGSPGVNW